MLVLPLHAPAAAVENIRIAYLGHAGSDAESGARQGTDEANAQGRFLGFKYELVTVSDVPGALAAQAAALVVEVDGAGLAELAAQATAMPVLNVSAEDDALRGQCIANLFHTIPSQAMRADAVAQWQRIHHDSHAVARAWHESAEKYAGTQLNKRYADRFGHPMSDQAWAAWAAVKLLSDTIARQRAVQPAALLAALKTSLAFDGQKGIDMSFRDNGQLRQPLLLIENGAIVGEAPVRGVASENDLDSLGPTHCSK